MTIDMQALMDRVAALEIEALAALTPTVDANAVDRFFHVQATYPFFVNRLGAITVDDDSEDLDVYVVNVQMRLLIGKITEGYEGEVENRLQVYIPQIITYFNERELLQSMTYADALDDISPSGVCRIVACTGFAVFQQSGVGTSLVGAEFTLRCELKESIEQVY
jgi:hypothetical protein